MKTTTKARNFVLFRAEDKTGVSGIGVVAEGTEFKNGKCALVWNTAVSSIGIYDSIRQLEEIHGHNGATSVVFVKDGGPTKLVAQASTFEENVEAASTPELTAPENTFYRQVHHLEAGEEFQYLCCDVPVTHAMDLDGKIVKVGEGNFVKLVAGVVGDIANAQAALTSFIKSLDSTPQPIANVFKKVKPHPLD